MPFECFRSPNYKWGSAKWTVVSSLVRISGSDRANPNFRGNNSLSKAVVSTKRIRTTFTTRYWQIFFFLENILFLLLRRFVFNADTNSLKICPSETCCRCHRHHVLLTLGEYYQIKNKVNPSIFSKFLNHLNSLFTFL